MVGEGARVFNCDGKGGGESNCFRFEKDFGELIRCDFSEDLVGDGIMNGWYCSWKCVGSLRNKWEKTFVEI